MSVKFIENSNYKFKETLEELILKMKEKLLRFCMLLNC